MEQEIIQNKICGIRAVRVMLDKVLPCCRALSQLAKKKDIQQKTIGYKAIQERRGEKQ